MNFLMNGILNPNKLNMINKLVLGIDIGGTNSVFGLVDQNGKIHFQKTLKTSLYPTPEKLVNEIYNYLNKINGFKKIIGIGIGAPNGNFFTGSIEFAPNLKWDGKIPLAEMFKEKFKLNVILTNDANAAAIGEMIYGAAKDLDNFVIITLGTGLGSGVVNKRKLIYGHDGFAGEYGHIRVIKNGRLCGCGRKGCLEAYVSATGVTRSIYELDSKNKSKSKLKQIKNPSSKDVFNLAKKGDLFSIEIIDYTAKILGSSLAEFSCFNSPKAYILFGGIAQNGNIFAQKVKRYMEKNLLNIYKDKIEIRISQLHNRNAALLGSASLIWNNNN
tara:strand:+ start:18915 stop:19901 length:987 start_codon:yes stop_codon:yes gene_type:complete